MKPVSAEELAELRRLSAGIAPAFPSTIDNSTAHPQQVYGLNLPPGRKAQFGGMSYREWLIGHAPTQMANWHVGEVPPDPCDEEWHMLEQAWPIAWADNIIAQLDAEAANAAD